MANIKSAKKRILVNQTKADRNKAIRSKVKTSIKKVDAAIAANDKEAAAAALVAATSEINKAATKCLSQEHFFQKDFTLKQSCEQNGIIAGRA